MTTKTWLSAAFSCLTLSLAACGGQSNAPANHSASHPAPAAPDPKLQALAEELALTNPDELTPRAAHELIYRWKQQLQNPKP